MNIFIPDVNPVKAAQYLCDKHVIKIRSKHIGVITMKTNPDSPSGTEEDLSPTGIVQKFKQLGMDASYHFADDSGKEWQHGYRLSNQARDLAFKHPELKDQFIEASKNFLWIFQWPSDPV